MHHLVLEVTVNTLKAVFAVAIGYVIVSPSIAQIPSTKTKNLVFAWIAIFFSLPLLSAVLDSFLDDKQVTYLSALRHDWPIILMFLSGLFISLIKRRRSHTLLTVPETMP